MEKRTIGSTDLQVYPVNLGGNVFGWTLDEKQSFHILDAFTGAGFNFIDTANTYSWWAEGNKGGESEAIIGKWMKQKGNRSQVIVATKVGSQNREHPVDSSRKHILASIDESLSRLQTDYIDLYYTHFDDGVTPVEETLSAYDEIVKAGKVRWIGASNLTPERLLQSLQTSRENGYPSYQALQPLYNLVERKGYEDNYAPIAQEYHLGVLPYYALAAGFLTGKYRSEADLGKSVRGQGAKKYLDDRGLAVLAALDTVAGNYGSDPATVALAWLLSKPNIVAPIVSATSDAQLQSIIKAPALLLTAEDLRLLDEASAA